jgi:hypothetical protein
LSCLRCREADDAKIGPAAHSNNPLLLVGDLHLEKDVGKLAMGRTADIYVVLVTPRGQLLTIGSTLCPCLVETPRRSSAF